MVFSLVNKRTDNERHERVAKRQRVILQRRYRPLKHHEPEIFDIDVEGIEKEEPLYIFTKGVNGIEYRGHIHKKHRKYAPKILYVAEENEHCREDKSHADIKEYQAKNWEE